MKRISSFILIVMMLITFLIVPLSAETVDNSRVVKENEVSNNTKIDDDYVLMDACIHIFVLDKSLSNNTYHYYVCLNCGAMSYATHNIVYSSTCTTSDYCIECKYIAFHYTDHLVPGQGVYGYWSTSEHYKTCGRVLRAGNVCSYKSSFDVHHWGGTGSIATCKECGATK